MAKLQGTFKLRVNIGGREFEAEGQPDLVSRQFEAFCRLIQEAGLPRPETRPPLDPAPAEERGDTDISTLFRMSPHSRLLSLREPPQGKFPEADAVLILLLGHKRLRSEDEVPVTVLTDALKQSGCPVKRLDRILTVHMRDHSVLRTGRGKGGKYRLTNVGVNKADALAAQLSSAQF